MPKSKEINYRKWICTWSKTGKCLIKWCWTQWPSRRGMMNNNHTSVIPPGPLPLIWRTRVMNVWESLSLSTLTTCCFLPECEGGSALDVIAHLPGGAACWDTPSPHHHHQHPPPSLPSLPAFLFTPRALIFQPILLSWGDSPLSGTVCVCVCVSRMSKVSNQYRIRGSCFDPCWYKYHKH